MTHIRAGRARSARITGGAFFVLAAGLAATAAASLAAGRAPESTFWGATVSLVSIVTMWLLIRAKMAVGRALVSAAILADAACTRACLLLSFVLLASSLGYRFTGIGGLDAAGALGIAWFAFREGREAFGKASRRYPSRYSPRPGSRQFVLHLGHWYAQSHPTEDFAETPAVWLQPRSRWRAEYAGWPALEKLTVSSTVTQGRHTRNTCVSTSSQSRRRFS